MPGSFDDIDARERAAGDNELATCGRSCAPNAERSRIKGVAQSARDSHNANSAAPHDSHGALLFAAIPLPLDTTVVDSDLTIRSFPRLRFLSLREGGGVPPEKVAAVPGSLRRGFSRRERDPEEEVGRTLLEGGVSSAAYRFRGSPPSSRNLSAAITPHGMFARTPSRSRERLRSGKMYDNIFFFYFFIFSRDREGRDLFNFLSTARAARRKSIYGDTLHMLDARDSLSVPRIRLTPRYRFQIRSGESLMPRFYRVEKR